MGLFGLQPSLSADRKQLEEKAWLFFRIFCAPAAGPRNKCTMGLDVKLRSLYRSGDLGSEPRWLLGGSFAALRFSALVTGCVSGEHATEELQEAFTSMVYHPSMSQAEARQLLKSMMERLYSICAPRLADIVHNPTWRMAIMVTAMKPWVQILPEWQLQAVFYTFLAINTATPAIVDLLQRRICFYTGPSPPPFGQEEDILFVPLTEFNYHQVLHATTCIPFVSVPCRYIAGVGRGLFYDGALSDYHLNFKIRDPALLLSAGCAGDPVLARCWDLFAPWRSLKEGAFEHVSILCPTQEFVDQLPSRELPETGDFFKKKYTDNPEARFEAWNKTFALSSLHMPDHPLNAVIFKYGELKRPLNGPLDYLTSVSWKALTAAKTAAKDSCSRLLSMIGWDVLARKQGSSYLKISRLGTASLNRAGSEGMGSSNGSWNGSSGDLSHWDEQGERKKSRSGGCDCDQGRDQGDGGNEECCVHRRDAGAES